MENINLEDKRKKMEKIKYVDSIINIANQWTQATRSKHIGQMSDLIKDFRNFTDDHSVDSWGKFYGNKEGVDKIDEASNKIWKMIKNIKENLDKVDKEYVDRWAKDLIIHKSHSGLQIQLDILNRVSKKSCRLASADEESMGIDGYVDGEPVQIKSETYKSTLNSNNEKIPYRKIYYKKSKNGFKILN